jgi:uncharacterized protein (DUF1015 family)
MFGNGRNRRGISSVVTQPRTHPMSDVRPFRAWRPKKELAAEVAAPPYDVLNSEEAREMAKGHPLSFLHVGKPEIDLPPKTDLHAPEVYARGAENLRRLVSEGVLEKDPESCYYAYQQTMGKHVQVGLVAAASVAEYDSGLIKKHELTRRDKEDDRTRHVEVLNSQTGPVFLTYRKNPAIDAIIESVRREPAWVDFTAPDGIGHKAWVISDPGRVEGLRREFGKLACLYVADGHHRSAAASRVAANRKAANPKHTGQEEYNYFLTVIFPDDQMQILDYNRVVMDLRGMTPEQFLSKVGEMFTVAPTDTPKPAAARTFGMYLRGKWYRLVAKPGTFPEKDPVGCLDISILQRNLLAPVLGIEDPRTDKRVDFVGGIRGLKELEKRVSAGAAVAFALFPTSIRQLMAIADAGQIMPPKSTWFEPKLRDGLFIHALDDRPLGGQA